MKVKQEQILYIKRYTVHNQDEFVSDVYFLQHRRWSTIWGDTKLGTDKFIIDRGIRWINLSKKTSNTFYEIFDYIIPYKKRICNYSFKNKWQNTVLLIFFFN